MNITIKLTNAQVKGIRKYLYDTSPDINPKITSEQIKREIGGEMAGLLYVGAIGDYVMNAEREEFISQSNQAS